MVFLISHGSHVEDSDATILDAASREVYEETGLTVTEFLAETPSFEYSVEKILHSQTGESPVTVSKTTIQLNFVATVAVRLHRQSKSTPRSTKLMHGYQRTK
jgi:8-oxo-dGTP pyrophosphatase MutT (NUDIX family)